MNKRWQIFTAFSLLYVLAYGAGFVAQGVPADMDGLAKMIEEAIRYPGFSFVNIQSPCVTFGDPDRTFRRLLLAAALLIDARWFENRD